jgi:4-hydroxybenzoyl-CoA thioesterase
MPHRFSVIVAFGDCDEAGIVFYPTYFYWFDSAFQDLLRARGLSQRKLRARFGVRGTPIVEAGATFRAPATYDDPLQVEITLERWGDTSFRLGYRVTREQTVILDGFEVRVWAVSGSDGRLSTAPVPAEFKELIA